MSRLEWILGLVLLLLLVAVVALSASLWLTPDGAVTRQDADELALAAAYAEEIAPTRTTAVETAKNAYLLANRAAQGWQGDARLLNATATWPQGMAAPDLAFGREAWGFIFYSPTTQTTAVVSVSNGAATISPRETRRQLQPLDITSWRLDSNDAAELFLANGGEMFIEREGVTVYSMTLSLNDPHLNGRIEWLLSLLEPQNGRSFSVRIDATSGEVLEIIDAS